MYFRIFFRLLCIRTCNVIIASAKYSLNQMKLSDVGYQTLLGRLSGGIDHLWGPNELWLGFSGIVFELNIQYLLYTSCYNVY